MSEAGLNTVNLSELNTFQQFLLFALILIGSAIFVSVAVVHVRKTAFERRFKNLITDQHRQSKGSENVRLSRLPSAPSARQQKSESGGTVIEGGMIEPADRDSVILTTRSDEKWMSFQSRSVEMLQSHENQPNTENASSSNIQEEGRSVPHQGEGPAHRVTLVASTTPVKSRPHHNIFSMQGVGARHDITNHPNYSTLSLRRPATASETMAPLKLDPELSPRLPSTGHIGRNSQFSSLTFADRERLGGVEYRAVEFLAVIVPTYYLLWQILGCLGLGAYIARNRAETTRANGLNPWYASTILSD